MRRAVPVGRLADRRVRHLTRMRARARDDRVWGETLRGGCPGQDSNLHGSCLPWDFKSGPALEPTILGDTPSRRSKQLGGSARAPVLRLDPSSVVEFDTPLTHSPHARVPLAFSAD